MSGKTIVIYYSYTGNNAALAERIAAGLGAASFRLLEREKRTLKGIALDMLLNRRPKLENLPGDIGSFDLAVFVGPVWMFHIPSPLRTCFKAMKRQVKKYAYVSLSGGALGPNTRIAAELQRRLGKGLALLLDLNAAHFCGTTVAPTMNEASEYLVSEHPEDLERLGHIAVEALRGIRV